MPAGTSISYRPEIDGLRALAVVPVILFHADFTLFSGGFVGVDIFFVISGYLITAIIISEIEKGDFSLVRFYERRARRILPALFVVMVCCIPPAWLWMDPSQYRSFAKGLAAVALFGSNFFFWWETNYFNDEAAQNPLLHTWSLSVEEQFYLVFPLMLLLLWRFGRSRLLVFIAILAAASLILSELMWREAPAANFYLAPTRAWELFAGAICVFVLHRNTALVSARAGNLLSLAGLGMIVAAVLIFDEETHIPSVYGLLPVVGACLVILFADRPTWTARILSTPLLVGIGLISYSAYLWHQPLFAFARIRIPYDLGAAGMLFFAGLAFGLGYLTWRFVEKPFRLGRAVPLVTRRQMFGLAAAAGCVLIAAAFTNNKQFYFNGLSSKARYYAGFSGSGKGPERTEEWGGKCNVKDKSSSLGTACLRIDPGKKNYLLIGDSHAAHLSRSLREAFPNDKILQATSLGCRPFIVQAKKPWCDRFYGPILKDFIPNNQVDGVILAARWNKKNARVLDETLGWMSKYVKRIIVIGPAMAYRDRLPFILRDYERFGESFAGGLASRYIDSTRYEVNEVIRDITQKRDVEFVDILAAQCPDRKCHVVTAKDEPVAFDHSHLTLPGSRMLINTLVKSGSLKLGPETISY